MPEPRTHSASQGAQRASSEPVPSIADIVVGLHDLRVRRVFTTFEFRTCEEYVHNVEILVENMGNEDCWAIPSIFYEKKVLVAFSAEDSRGGKAILTPSSKNDDILRKLLFYHCWIRTSEEGRKLLYRVFVNPERNPVPGANVETILNEQFTGRFCSDLSASMWAVPRPIADLLRRPLIDWVPEPHKQGFANQRDATLANLCCDPDYVDFFERLYTRFFQIIWLSKPIRPKELCSITVRDQRFVLTRRRDNIRPQIWRRSFGFDGSECVFPIEVDTPTPLHSGATFHIRIIPPEGVRLDLEPSRRGRLLRRSRLIYANEDTVVDRGKLDFHHPGIETLELCNNLASSLQLATFDSRPQRLSWNLSSLFVRRDVSDIRTRFEESVMMMYFKRDPSQTRLCHQSAEHFIRFRLGLKSDLARYIHWLIIFLLGVTVITTHFLLPERYLLSTSLGKYTIQPPFLALIDQYFWPIITLMISQSVAALFDYSRRPECQQHFLAKTTFIISMLALTECGLLILGPLALWLAAFSWPLVGIVLSLLLLCFSLLQHRV